MLSSLTPAPLDLFPCGKIWWAGEKWTEEIIEARAKKTHWVKDPKVLINLRRLNGRSSKVKFPPSFCFLSYCCFCWLRVLSHFGRVAV